MGEVREATPQPGWDQARPLPETANEAEAPFALTPCDSALHNRADAQELSCGVGARLAERAPSPKADPNADLAPSVDTSLSPEGPYYQGLLGMGGAGLEPAATCV